MNKLITSCLLLTTCYLLPATVRAYTYPTFDKTLKNGLKVIVCEKPGAGFAEVEVWYRVGSKDEHDGIRGMAHMFEHMMFRGTKNISGVQLMEKLDSVGADWNAYTTFDRTVYHEYVPSTAVSMSLMLEADRMANLNVTQEILNTERQVVGEEYRNGISNWYQKMAQDRYSFLYPDGHPYQYDVIGHLDEIVNFTAPQCMEFYNRYYSPNNAFVVVVGDVKHDDVFADAEKYFGVITKQLPAATAIATPDLFTNRVSTTDLDLNYPLQDYCYALPQPATTDPDYFAYDMLMALFFTDANSVLNERLDKKEHLVYAIIQSNETEDLYPSRATIDIFMPPMPGNVKVKREIRAEMDSVIANGLPADKMADFISNYKASQTFGSYSASGIADQLGMSEYYFRNYSFVDKELGSYQAVTQADIKRVAAKYFSADHVDIINIKPQE